MQYLAVDTETTGLGASARIAQIGMVLLDEDLDVRAEFQTYIQPEGWEMPEATAAFHGITQKDCQQFGIPISAALAIFFKFLQDETTAILAHNWQYDKGRILHELEVMEKPDLLSRRQAFCTMRMLTAKMNLPSSRGPKWPKLQEAHKYFFGEEFSDAHDAMADVRATIKVFKEIKLKHPELMRAA